MTIVISLINLTLLSLFCGGTIHSIWVIVDAFIFVGEHKHLLISCKKAMIYLNVNVVQGRYDYTLKKGSSRVAQCKFQMSLVIVRAECTEIVSESKIKRNQGKQILYKNPKCCWSFFTSDNLFLA